MIEDIGVSLRTVLDPRSKVAIAHDHQCSLAFQPYEGINELGYATLIADNPLVKKYGLSGRNAERASKMVGRFDVLICRAVVDHSGLHAKFVLESLKKNQKPANNAPLLHTKGALLIGTTNPASGPVADERTVGHRWIAV